MIIPYSDRSRGAVGSVAAHRPRRLPVSAVLRCRLPRAPGASVLVTHGPPCCLEVVAASWRDASESSDADHRRYRFECTRAMQRVSWSSRVWWASVTMTVTQVMPGQELPRVVPGVPMFIPVTDERLREPEPDNWLMYRRTYDGLGAAPMGWDWRRIQRLIAALGLSPTQVLGHRLLSCRATLGRGQSGSNAGAAQASTGGRGITALRELCRGRTAGKIRTHLNYFLKNRHRFAYSAGQRRRRKRHASSISASRAHPSIGYRRASTRFFSCGLSISPADGTVCSGWP